MTSSRTSKTLTVMTLLLWTFFATSSTLASPCPNGDPKLAQAGKTTPCDGILLSKADALRLAADSKKLEKAELEKRELGLKLQKAVDDIKREQELCDARLAACGKEVAGLRQLLTTPQPVPLVERPWFVATVAAVVVAAIAIPVTWLAVTESR